MKLPYLAPVPVRVSELPTSDTVAFPGFSFDVSQTEKHILPPPAEVRRQAKLNGTVYPAGRVAPVIFQSQGLIVKSGLDITTEEGKCLWAIKRKLKGRVPVPEVYGWCRDRDEVFIYMELVQGVTLEKRWDSLAAEDRIQICTQLREIVVAMRQLEQDAGNIFVGSIGRQQLQDIMFDCHENRGPFRTVKEFHDWYAALVHSDPTAFVDPFRPQLSDEASIRFTHGDLHRSNIIVSSETEGDPEIRAVIDWHQSGWYPDYWERNKTLYTAEPRGQWATEYVPRLLEPSSSDAAWDFYMNGLGC